MRASSVRNTSTNSSRSRSRPSARRDVEAAVDGPLGQRLGDERRPRPARRRGPAARSCSSSGATTSSTRPMRSASSACTWRPVRIRSLARAGPTSAGQPLRAAAAGDDAEQDLGLAEHGPLGRDAEVARQRQLAPAAEGVAADGGDHEPGDGGDGVEGVVERWRRSPAASSGAAELGDVGAGGEDPLAAGDDDGAGRVGRQRLGGRRAAARSSSADSALTFGLSRRDDGDAVVAPLDGARARRPWRRRYAVEPLRAARPTRSIARRRRRAARRRPPTGRAGAPARAARARRRSCPAQLAGPGLEARRDDLRAAPRAARSPRRCSSWPLVSSGPRWSPTAVPQLVDALRRRWRPWCTIGRPPARPRRTGRASARGRAGSRPRRAGRPC